jgi:peptidoglycan biosynthesis protein MviN/MurJ (putative lipid II flippase)
MVWMRVVLTVLTVGSSLISFGAYTLFLRYLGTSARVDQLFYAASVPLSLAGVASGVLLYLLPPVLTRLTRRRQEDTLRALLILFAIMIALAMVLAVLSALLGYSLRFLILFAGFSLTAGLQVASTLQICLAQARAQYVQTAIAPLLMAGGLLAGAVASIMVREEWLLLLGQLVGATAALWVLARSLGLRLVPSWKRDLLTGLAAFAPMRQHIVAILMGTTAFTLFQPIDAFICLRLGDGSVTIMAYAQRVLVALSGAVSLGAYVIAARTSRDAVRSGGEGALRRQANREAVRILAFAGLGWLGYEITGRSALALLLSSSPMSADDTARLLTTLKWMLLGLGPMAAMPYLFRVLYTLHEYFVPAALAVGVVAGYAAIAFELLQRYQILALSIAYVTVWWSALVAAMMWLNLAPLRLMSARPA